MQPQNSYLYYLIDPSYQVVNILFALLFSDKTVRTGPERYFFPNVDINTMLRSMNKPFLVRQ